MSEDVRERAFEPFFTTKEPGRGTGLGLSTVYGFVMQSRGDISISSAPGQGTTIDIVLPQARSQAGGEGAGDNPAAAVKPGLRVLLVEDDPEVRAVILNHLQTIGCSVEAVASAEQALRALDAGVRCDLLLTDIALGPGMRGTTLAAEVQRRFPTVRILLMSGFSNELIQADRDSPPTWDLLPKPCTRQELAGAVARVMAQDAAG